MPKRPQYPFCSNNLEARCHHVLHYDVVYLLGVGCRLAVASVVLSLTLGLNAVGKVLFGVVADRIGARLSLALSFAIIVSTASNPGC